MRRLVDFPEAREVPPHILRGLRAYDPTAELVYLGDGKWALGRVRPNRERYRVALRLLNGVMRGLSQEKKITPRGRAKIIMALLALQGFALVGIYPEHLATSSYVVHDFKRALWLLERTTDDQLFKDMDAEREKQITDAIADMGDDARARAAWRYAFTLSHLVQRPDSTINPSRSGFITQRRIRHV